MPHAKAGRSGTRKYGRNQSKCQQYKAENCREKNKIKKLVRHLDKYLNDKQANKSLHNARNSCKK